MSGSGSLFDCSIVERLVLVLVQIDLRLEESPGPGMPKAVIDYHR